MARDPLGNARATFRVSLEGSFSVAPLACQVRSITATAKFNAVSSAVIHAPA